MTNLTGLGLVLLIKTYFMLGSFATVTSNIGKTQKYHNIIQDIPQVIQNERKTAKVHKG